MGAKQKVTTEEFINRAKIKHNDFYDYSKTQYMHYKTKVTIVCKIHGEFEQIPGAHLFGKGCLKCRSQNQRLTNEEFIKKAIKVHGNTYDYSKTRYSNFTSKIIIVCQRHGEFRQLPNNHLIGHGCFKCRVDNRKRTIEDFIKIASLTHNGFYSYGKTVYVNALTKVIITCPLHGDFKQKPNCHINQKHGCPKCGCSESKGEKAIREFLESYDILFLQEHRIDNCRNSNTLPFDFFIPQSNLLIEYQGDIHYKIIDKWGGEDGLKQRQLHDKIKRDFALSNGYNFLEITYKDFDKIENILRNTLCL